MKWNRPVGGDTRTKEGFLIFPRTINRERRWMEYAEWDERYDSIWGKWKGRQWMNKSTGAGFREKMNLPRIRIRIGGDDHV